MASAARLEPTMNRPEESQPSGISTPDEEKQESKAEDVESAEDGTRVYPQGYKLGFIW
jgi:hypothetical protein